MHTHTSYSNVRLLDSINRPKDLIDRAIELGLSGIAITDHELLGAHVQVDMYRHEIAEKYPDFKIALGNEIYLTDDREPGQKYFHFILIAKNATGHKMLRELTSIAWENSYFDRGLERVPTLKSDLRAIVNKYGRGNLIASSACLGSEVDFCILKMAECEKKCDIDGKRQYYNQLINHINYCLDLFDNDFYLEVQPAQSKDQLIVNRKMSSIANYFNIKMVVTTDAHYLRKEDREVHKAYLNSKGGEREVDSFYAYAYLQSTEEIIENLAGTGLDYKELEKNTLEVYNKIEDYSFKKNQQVPEVKVTNFPKKNSSFGYKTIDELYRSDNIQERYWVNSCVDKLKELNLYNDTYLSRLEEEADIQKVIGEKLGTCMFAYPIFLQHYIDLFWECGSTVGAGRGSACSGLNHYLLGITQLDPIEWSLPYWRYSNKERVELGDIDIDICPSKRELIFEKIREERGKFGCIQVCTYGTETTKSAIKTACRGYRSSEFPDGIDVDVAEYMSSLIPQERGFLWDLSDVVYGNTEKDRRPVHNFLDEVNKYPGLLDIMISIEGLVCRRGIHASGVIFYDDDPYETACFMKAKNGAMTTQYSLHDAEYCSDVKYDFLVTEVQDVIVQCLELLQEYNLVEQDLSLRELYNKYLHPDNLPIQDNKIWDALANGNVLKCFQFDTQVGGQTAKMVKPTNPIEMSNCNSAMRLVATEKGGETPTERIIRMKKNIQEWYDEMQTYGLTQKEQKVLEPYYLPANGMPAQQEDLMQILMDENVCGFSLKQANDARKICAKKQMNRIEELHNLVMETAKSAALGKYVWDTAIKTQLGYSFSRIHSLAYSFIGIQTIYLATYFPSVYWNTACLRIDSGLDEEASTNYSKIAKAVGNIMNRGINLSLIDINKSQYMFEPDEESDTIIYGMKALNGIGGEIAQTIIENRPYTGWQDFLNKTHVNKTVMISLIKSGAFDQFGERADIMREYIWSVCEPKKRVTLQNFNSLMQRNLIPQELTFQKRLFVFNKALKANCKIGDYFSLAKSNYFKFYSDFFDVDLLEPCGETIGIKESIWKKLYTDGMKPAKDYFKNNQEQILKTLNDNLFQETWDKYADGSYAHWEMDSLGMYYHAHELANVRAEMYDIQSYGSLPENPIVTRTFKRNGHEYPIYELNRIMGTVIAKDDAHSSISILTVNDGVVTVKMNRDYFAKYNRRISEIQPDGTKKIKEHGWFQKGTLVICYGVRKGDLFMCKSYKNSPSHQLYKITNVYPNGAIDMTNLRYGEME